MKINIKKNLFLFLLLITSCVIFSGGCGGGGSGDFEEETETDQPTQNQNDTQTETKDPSTEKVKSQDVQYIEKIVYIEVEKEDSGSGPVYYIAPEERLANSTSEPKYTVVKSDDYKWKIDTGDTRVSLYGQKIDLEYKKATAESFDISIIKSDDISTTGKDEYAVKLSGDEGVYTWSDYQFVMVDFESNDKLPYEALPYIQDVVAVTGARDFVKKTSGDHDTYVYTHTLSNADEKAFSTYIVLDKDNIDYVHTHYKGSSIPDTIMRFKLKKVLTE